MMEKISSYLCKTSDLGVHGNLFGGTMMSWLDESGAIMACQVCKTSKMVTILFEPINFKKPVKEKHQVRIYGEVTGIGETSIVITLEARRVSQRLAEYWTKL
jgi:acyl-CoA thioesterase YciA